MPSRAPLIVAIAILWMPVLYVAAYFAMVTPGVYGSSYIYQGKYCPVYTPYRAQAWLCSTCFWPLEIVDRKIRPTAWVDKDDDPRAPVNPIDPASELPLFTADDGAPEMLSEEINPSF